MRSIVKTWNGERFFDAHDEAFVFSRTLARAALRQSGGQAIQWIDFPPNVNVG